ncbi:hypothetical protein MC885_016537 [Smutsia gigantea]|nr:hypothetical protein MC885_016537 [Smutsia gigantea]
MGTRAPQGLLLLLCLQLLPPRGASAGSLHSPGLSECFQVNGADYRGHQNRTGPRGAGRPCLFWDQTQQHSYSSASDPQGRWGLGAHNFCRNPDGDVQPWCYVAETEEGIYWRYCDIPTCHSERARLDKVPGYLGCFVDSGAPPALSGPSGTSTKLTVQVCLRFCRMKGYQLAGVEAGYACFCGSESDLARGRPAPATDCDQICFGHPGQLCGGDGRLGVYEAGGGRGPAGGRARLPAGLRGLTEALPAVSVGSCQGNWTTPQGVLYSPDFPDEYGPDRNCSWALGPQGAALELTFRLFELADPRDRLELRDAASGSLLRAFDGARPPPAGPLRRAPPRCCSPSAATRGHAQGFALTYRGEARPPAPPARAPPRLTVSAGLLDAADGAPAPGSAQTPAAPLGGANVSGSPWPAAPEAGVGARALPTLAAVPALLLLLPLLSLLRRRSCLPAPREGRPALRPPGGPGRSWAVWYRQPRGAAIPYPSGDPQAEGLAASYRPLSASSQSSLRSLISAL